MTTGAQTPHPARPRRSRLRTVLPLAVAAWLVLQIWLLTLLAGATNGLVALLVLVAGLVLGSAVINRAGRRAFTNLGETLHQQQSGSVAGPRRARRRPVLPRAGGAWLVLEIWLRTLLAGATNGLVVLLVLVAGLVLGSAVIKRAGRRAFKNRGETLQQQQGGSVAGPRP